MTHIRLRPHAPGVKWYVHSACSLILALALQPSWAPAAFIGSTLPDVFEKSIGARHRSLHELMLWLTLLPLMSHPLYGGLALGSLHHILVDALTLHGVTAAGRRLRGPLNTNRPVDNLAVLLLHLPLLFL